MKKIIKILLLFVAMISFNHVFAQDTLSPEEEKTIMSKYGKEYAKILRTKIDFNACPMYQWYKEYSFDIDKEGNVTNFSVSLLNSRPNSWPVRRYFETKLSLKFEKTIRLNPPPPIPKELRADKVEVVISLQKTPMTITAVYYSNSNDESQLTMELGKGTIRNKILYSLFLFY